MENRKAAIAIKYNADDNKAPEILAAGEGLVAEKIIEVANASGVPVKSDSPVASAVLESKVAIPQELYGLVAEVLWFVHRLDTQWHEKVSKIASGSGGV